MTTKATCRQRWYNEKEGRIHDLRKVWNAYLEGKEEGHPDLGNIYEYGLSFDYVAPETFNGQTRGYWRYQFSWGGPSDEVRYYSDGPQFDPNRVTYVFLDWFDGHERNLQGKDKALMLDLWEWFSELGSVQAEYDKAIY